MKRHSDGISKSTFIPEAKRQHAAQAQAQAVAPQVRSVAITYRLPEQTAQEMLASAQRYTDNLDRILRLSQNPALKQTSQGMIAGLNKIGLVPDAVGSDEERRGILHATVDHLSRLQDEESARNNGGRHL